MKAFNSVDTNQEMFFLSFGLAYVSHAFGVFTSLWNSVHFINNLQGKLRQLLKKPCSFTRCGGVYL